MAPALILTEEMAAERGYMGSGPFTFPDAFPGVWVPGEPVALSELGFATQDDADEALEASEVPLEWTDVDEGEGIPERDNHAASMEQAVTADVEETRKIRNHADADAVAAELGLEFPTDPRPTVREKIALIEEARAGTPGDTQEITPAPGAEGTTPQADDEGSDE